ncbi:MAG: hypothetical protein AAGD43_14565 [Pseudomonadota bacterium]
MGLIDWWQATDLVGKATVLGTLVATLALIWAILSHFWRRKPNDGDGRISIKRSTFASGSGDITNSQVNIDASSKSDPK